MTDFIIVDEVPLDGLGKALLNGCAKACGFLHQTQSSVFHQTLGVSASTRGDLRKLSFLLRGEMHFHGLRIEISRT